MKVDVEGAELRVFQGAKGILSGSDAPIVLYECSEVLAAPFGTTSAEIKAFLVDHRYSIYRLRGGRLQPVSVDEAHIKIEDVFAFQPRHFDLHPSLRALAS